MLIAGIRGTPQENGLYENFDLVIIAWPYSRHGTNVWGIITSCQTTWVHGTKIVCTYQLLDGLVFEVSFSSDLPLSCLFLIISLCISVRSTASQLRVRPRLLHIPVCALRSCHHRAACALTSVLAPSCQHQQSERPSICPLAQSRPVSWSETTRVRVDSDWNSRTSPSDQHSVDCPSLARWSLVPHLASQLPPACRAACLCLLRASSQQMPPQRS